MLLPSPVIQVTKSDPWKQKIILRCYYYFLPSLLPNMMD